MSLRLSTLYPTAYSRVCKILDSNSTIHSLASFVQSDLHQHDKVSTSNVLVVVGLVSSRLCLIIAHEPTRQAGAMSSGAINKIIRAQDIALQQHLPVIYLVESAGLNLSHQSHGFVDIGAVFARMASLSKHKIPQASVCYGTATAGGAYLVGMADYCIFLARKARVFLAGPNLVSYAIGERNTPEQLGGEKIHALSGLMHDIASDEADIATLLRSWLTSQLRWPVFTPSVNFDYQPSSYILANILDKTPGDYRKMFATRELVLACIDADWHEFKPSSQSRMLCVFGSVMGRPLAIIANLAPIDTQAAIKVVQFISACENANTPLLFWMHTTGFQVGRDAEASGIIPAGSSLIRAVTNTNLPKITLQVGGAFGAGYYAMCGRPFGADVVLSWPTAKLAVMGPEPAAQLMTSLRVHSAKKRGVVMTSEEKKSYYDRIESEFTQQMDISYTTARLWDDAVIQPLDTPECLAFWLDVFAARPRSKR